MTLYTSWYHNGITMTRPHNPDRPVVVNNPIASVRLYRSAVAGTTGSTSTNYTLLNSDFETATVADPISNADMWAAMGSQTGGTSTFARTSVTTATGQGKILNQHFLTGQVGGGSGISMFPPLSRAVSEATITYQVRFANPGDWGIGGKLPGLGGILPGQGNPPTGGSPSPYGWTSRGMWITPAAGYSSENPKSPVEWVGYVYDPLQPSNNYGQNRRTGQSFVFGTWHTVTQYHKMNSIASEGVSGNADGIHRMWFDGALCFEKLNQVYRIYANAKITHLAWSMFYGGATVDWAPSIETNVQIDNLLITTPEA